MNSEFDEKTNATVVEHASSRSTEQLNSANLQPEPLLNEEEKRLTMFPIKHPDIWEMYKKHEAAIWHAHEVKLNRDLIDWNKMTSDEKHFVKYILAFFASSDMIIADNLAGRFMKEVQVTEAKVFYGFQLMMENIHCVAPETMILTDKGYFPISNLVDQSVNVWNGFEFSKTVVKKTSKTPVELIKVTLSNGAVIEATYDHKWVIKDQEERKLTKDLTVGDIITSFTMPIIYDGQVLDDAYNKGSQFATDKIIIEDDKKNKNLRKVFEQVPLTCNLTSRLNWFAGYLDVNMINNFSKQDDNGWYLYDNIEILRRIQLLLQTFGLHVNISNAVEKTREVVGESVEDLIEDVVATMIDQIEAENIEVVPYILLTKLDLQNLKRLGFATKVFRMDMKGKINVLLDYEVSISSVEHNERKSLTYCFNEPVNHTGIFNGVITGQSEVYSLMIDTYITDEAEKTLLFDAVKTIPCVKKKANWAMKWIESSDSFAERLVAFAIVEGIFFSGAFCCIYWLNERRLMPGLAKGNDFIARDEGMHTDFACLLYNKFIINKLSKERFEEILKEAVDVEIEFITEAIPCSLIGMNAKLMISYIKYVANRLTKQLGHAEIYTGVKQPFDFMDRICLRSKSNFFENEPSEYQKKNSDVDGDDFYTDL